MADDGTLALRRADVRWALADVVAERRLHRPRHGDNFTSGAGFGILFRVSTDDSERITGYSFDVDPIYSGAASWSASGTTAASTGSRSPTRRSPTRPPLRRAPHRGRASATTPSSPASTARRSMNVPQLSRLDRRRHEPCRGGRIGVQAWSTTRSRSTGCSSRTTEFDHAPRHARALRPAGLASAPVEIEEYARIAAAEDDHWWYRNTRAVMADLLGPWLTQAPPGGPRRRLGRAATAPGSPPTASVVGADLSPRRSRSCGPPARDRARCARPSSACPSPTRVVRRRGRDHGPVLRRRRPGRRARAGPGRAPRRRRPPHGAGVRLADRRPRQDRALPAPLHPARARRAGADGRAHRRPARPTCTRSSCRPAALLAPAERVRPHATARRRVRRRARRPRPRVRPARPGRAVMAARHDVPFGSTVAVVATRPA